MATFDKLLAPGGYGAVIAITPVSRILRDKSIEQQIRRGALTLNEIGESKALVRRYPGLTEETLSAGMLSTTPAIPADDLDTVGLQWLLVAQSRLSTAAAGNLARAMDALQDELETVLRGAVVGLRDGTISKDGLDTFKLGYEFVRDELAMRRDSLKRHAGQDDNVVIVKAAQSA